MKHFIVTRFGYPPGYEHLEERIAMFNRFALPSIQAQTNQNFEWLLLGDRLFDVPGARWFGDQPKIALRSGHLNDGYLKYIRKVCLHENLVLMTRFDNDDILMPTFVEDLQKVAKTPGLVDFRGYRLDLSSNKRPRFQAGIKFYKDTLYHKGFTSPMITLVQTVNRGTIYKCNHAMMAKHFDVTFVEKPNWVQVIHDNNWLMATRQTKLQSEPFYPIPAFVEKLLEGFDATNC
jgi:hypothetical protein